MAKQEDKPEVKIRRKKNVVSRSNKGKKTFGLAIVNTEKLEHHQLSGKTVRCPACDQYVFKQWPFGWDSHAGEMCRGMHSISVEDRKKEFKRKYGHLFGKGTNKKPKKDSPRAKAMAELKPLLKKLDPDQLNEVIGILKERF
jgi:hypothetical protein